MAINDEGGGIFRSLSVELSTQAGVQVEYWTGSSPHLVTTSDTESKTSYTLPLPRLRANSTYTYQVKAVQGGQPGSAINGGTFQTGALPDDLASIPFTAQGTATSPLTFLTIFSTFKGGVIVDSEGQVVWYARTPSSSLVSGATRRANGNWVMIAHTNGLYEFTPLGKTASTLAQSTKFGAMHHDVIATPQNTLLFLTFEPKDFNGTSINGEGIWEWNPATGDVTRRWLAFDFFDPTVDKGTRSSANDWFHANSLFIGPRGNIVVSANFLDQVLSIASDYKSIEWRLGGPGSTIDLLPEQTSSGQHSASEVAPFDVLIFDNNFDGAKGQYSRAYERKFDPATKAVVSTWEYRPTPDNWSRIISSARRLSNGNTLVTFGSSKNLFGSTGPTAIHEVNSAGTLVWSMTIGIPEDKSSYVFRGEPLESIGGEKVLR
jgi:arylsulfate sulfotransferase